MPDVATDAFHSNTIANVLKNSVDGNDFADPQILSLLKQLFLCRD